MISDEEIAAAWAAFDPEAPDKTLAYFADVSAANPDDARAVFEYASALDSAGREEEAAREYERALALGLPDQLRQNLRIQYGSTLRNLGRHDEAVAVLREAYWSETEDLAAPAFLALALASAGRGDEGVGVLINTLLSSVADPRLRRYQRSLNAYAGELVEDLNAAYQEKLRQDSSDSR